MKAVSFSILEEIEDIFIQILRSWTVLINCEPNASLFRFTLRFLLTVDQIFNPVFIQRKKGDLFLQIVYFTHFFLLNWFFKSLRT